MTRWGVEKPAGVSRRLVLGAAAGVAAPFFCLPAKAQTTESTLRLQQLLANRGPGAGVAADDPDRLALLAEADAALRHGQTDAAQAALERAALMRHAADVEIGLVHCFMQRAQYAQALAFCAHVAGVHRETPQGTLLYAHLLRQGGQAQIAEQLLLRARQQHGDDADWQEALKDHAPPDPRHRPFALGPAAPANWVVHGAATRWPDGQHVFTPLGTLRGAHQAWVRDGRGWGGPARWKGEDRQRGIAWWQLESPWPAPPTPWPVQALEVFAGSPVWAAESTPQADARPAWPTLRLGFLGRSQAEGQAPRLGVDLPGPGPRGGPVFDARGALLGMALPDTARAVGGDRVISGLHMAEAAGLERPEVAVRGALRDVHSLYQQALTSNLQLLGPV